MRPGQWWVAFGPVADFLAMLKGQIKIKEVKVKFRQFLLFAICAWFLAFEVSAAIVIPPPDLNPGDQYRLVFVTSGARDAISGDIADYNSFVNAQAALVSASGFPTSGWTAIASTVDVAARDNTGTNPASGAGVPIYRVDGVRVADDNADLWESPPPAASISVTQFGTTYPNTTPPCASFPYCLAWTGAVGFGTSNPVSSLGGSGGTAAGNIFLEPDVSNFSWIQGYFDSSSNSYPFYAMSAVLTVGSEPPASYTVGGSISGLTGSVTLQNNGGDNLVRSSNGAFTFASALIDSSAYSVTVFAQPAGQTCGVANGSGTISSASISDVVVTCTDDVVIPPGPPSGATQIPTLSVYGLLVMAAGLLFVGGYRLRAVIRG